MNTTLPPRLAILITSANGELSSTLAAMLRRLGLTNTRIARDSAEAFRLLSQSPYDAMIIDNAIGPEDGISVTRRVRLNAAAPNRAMAIVMVSGDMPSEQTREAQDAGIDEFVHLPTTAQTLAARLESAIAAPRPFVVSPTYAGPDRRREETPIDGQDRRTPVNGSPKPS
ncbi:response regulator [Pelagibacterium halotolerans]|uniref:Chemotaxis protein CheYIII n=1 Tax=Pelagibacterium halotolerans (strain DSM 22347 / JCM 15775 / CGMCC 1.7692 / B2) TaxID=1082931 RepID=G4R9Z9_PELHB|nr:response regulator [Pelagibacterium halotolerans]AEQ52526.1 chemotaxis protein CheYIII [Pelagibacterium halotolerans B2]QJR17753.1 response regulator [Pelagibacterium halotolerans]SEA39095.1 Response regulator receiver domain-containing protein [Pelagibacterium halotolerans]